MTTETDAVLLERLRAGDAAAFEELLALHHSNMLRFVRSFVRSGAAAEELVQETWPAGLGAPPPGARPPHRRGR